MNEVNIDGQSNKVAANNYYDIKAEAINIDSQAQHIDERPLVPAQRKVLHGLISDIEGFGELTARDIWLKLHAVLGVCSINEITISQFEKADKFLTDEFEAAAEKASCNMLIHLILTEINNRTELKDKMNHYSKKHFGTSDLKKLQKIQLQNLLNYVEEVPTQSIPQPVLNQVITLMKTQPKPALIILAVGFVLGVIIS